jgi:hypothetical protein
MPPSDLVWVDAHGYPGFGRSWVRKTPVCFPSRDEPTRPRVRQPVKSDVVEDVVAGRDCGKVSQPLSFNSRRIGAPHELTRRPKPDTRIAEKRRIFRRQTTAKMRSQTGRFGHDTVALLRGRDPIRNGSNGNRHGKAGVHFRAWRRGSDLAACQPRAATGDAGDRVSQ